MFSTWKESRRRARAARLRREVTDLQALLLRLDPDIDHKLIMQTHNSLAEKRQKLLDLTTNRKEASE